MVNFVPSFGHEYKKIRPALIIQNDQYVQSSNLLTVIPISSQIAKRIELDVLDKKDLKNRLLTDSLLKIKQISSFVIRRFIKLIGEVGVKTIEEVKENVRLFLI